MEFIAKKLDKQKYSKYKALLNKEFEIDGIKLKFTKIQGDPFARPSIVEIVINKALKYKNRAIDDYLYRKLYENLKKHSKKLGEGKSGLIYVPKPSNLILRRSAVEVKNNIKFRVFVGLPSKRRRILGENFLKTMDNLIKAVKETIKTNYKELEKVNELYKKQNYIQKFLIENNYISFIANGSILPRKCGNCEEPLENATPFESPKELEYTIEFPNGEEICGMLLRKGLITITGNAFYGKSTLLESIALGVYFHKLGDGRELVITNPNSIYAFSEDGRVINNTDISSFVNLPKANSLYTENASGATSLSSFIQESIELGAKNILIDEDTSATNLLYFDERLNKLFKEKTVNSIQELSNSMVSKGINIILVSGTNYTILTQSDEVILADKYRYKTLNLERVKVKESKEYKFPKLREIEGANINKVKVRENFIYVKSKSIERVEVKIKTVRETSQLNTIALALYKLNNYKGGIKDFCKLIEEKAKNGEWNFFTKIIPPDLAEINRFEIGYVINRLSKRVIKLNKKLKNYLNLQKKNNNSNIHSYK